MYQAGIAADECFFIFDEVKLVGGEQSQPYCSENTADAASSEPT
jgi:hypothetical protein